MGSKGARDFWFGVLGPRQLSLGCFVLELQKLIVDFRVRAKKALMGDKPLGALLKLSLWCSFAFGVFTELSLWVLDGKPLGASKIRARFKGGVEEH